MNYKDKLIAVTGSSGFLGNALYEELGKQGADVEAIHGDIRDPKTFEALDHTYDYIFHFAAPSSQVLFKRKPAYCVESTLLGFMNVVNAAKKHGIRLIYPSTGLLSQGTSNEYARCKQICEDLAKGSGIDSLGLRIFATYGPGEGHKADYASVPYLFARDFAESKSPIIFGDGKQVRDFIYIDDVVMSILHLAEECPDAVVDIGSGKQTSFNEIIKLLNENYFGGVIKPEYVEKPGGYVKETMADPTRLHDFYKPSVSFAEGIKRVTKSLEGGDE